MNPPEETFLLLPSNNLS